MAEANIPEYIEVLAGGLIRAEDVNGMQRQARNSVRTHRHTGESLDTSSDDNAPQIATNEIEDNAVTSDKIADGDVTTEKLADGAVTGEKLSGDAITADVIPDGAVTSDKIANNAVSTDKIADEAISNAKLQDNAVATGNIQDNAVNFTKLDFEMILDFQSVNVGLGVTAEFNVATGIPNSSLKRIYFPLVSVTASGGGTAMVEPSIVYRAAVGATTYDVRICFINRGSATAGIFWSVFLFAN